MIVGRGGSQRLRRAALVRRLTSTSVYLVTDERLSLDELLASLDQSLVAGVGAVQLRAKTLDRGLFYEHGQAVHRLCRKHGALFIVNDAADIAALLRADGLHLGQTDLPPALARRIVGERMLLGISVSALEEARTVERDSAIDYLGVGAMFPTDTKPDAEFGGVELLSGVREAVSKPLVAIGGITTSNAASVWAARADLIAVVSAVFSAADPGQAVRQLAAARGEATTSAPPRAD